MEDLESQLFSQWHSDIMMIDTPDVMYQPSLSEFYANLYAGISTSKPPPVPTPTPPGFQVGSITQVVNRSMSTLITPVINFSQNNL